MVELGGTPASCSIWLELAYAPTILVRYPTGLWLGECTPRRCKAECCCHSYGTTKVQRNSVSYSTTKASDTQVAGGLTRTRIPDVLTLELAADRGARAGVAATGSSRNDRHSGLVLPRSNVYQAYQG